LRVRCVLCVVGEEEVGDLVAEGEDGGFPGLDEGGVDGCAAVGEVVGSQGGCGVVFRREEADPVGAVGGGPAWVGGVAEGVGGGGGGAVYFEAWGWKVLLEMEVFTGVLVLVAYLSECSCRRCEGLDVSRGFRDTDRRLFRADPSSRSLPVMWLKSSSILLTR